MVLRNLHRRSRPFRYAGHLCLMLVIVALLGTPRSSWHLGLGAGYCLFWPFLVEWRNRRQGSARAVRLNLRLHLIECCLTGALLGWLSLPPVPVIAVITVLLASNAAQAGWWLAWRGAGLLAAGAGLGFLACTRHVAASTMLADALSVILLVTHTIGLGLTSFTRAQHLHQAQTDLQRRSLVLDQLNQRLGRYLPRPVQARIRRQPQELCTLERRWLTVAFVDVVGFTELAARLAPEELAVILNDYFSASARLFDAAGGTLASLQGDGVLVYFGDQGDCSRQRAAVDCVESCGQVDELLEELAVCWHRQGYLVKLATRVGVAAGYCTLGDWGAERLDFTVIGSPVNLASRLQNHARDNALLISEAAAALLCNELELGPARRFELKGLGTEVAFELAVADADRSVDPAPPSAKVPRPRG
ncbi:MAG: adenylate/guanylate cyclase domain-containing protein [Gammaproteobacteria bacterium]|nr:adenylate/guanylate cyclase domain-containing protein [Gammaproteobacteria bacterium]